MAIQLRASSSFSSAPSTRSQRHDVFLSFRGEDTRDSFTGHLYDSLVQRGIKTFMDNDLTRGEEISQALLRAIEESKLSVIVFSENYASSKWCLEELVHILKCRRLKNQMVLPIFYKVDPSDVRHQRGKFGESHADLERRFKDDMRKVLRWRAALSEAATLSGWHFSSGYELILIDRIVEQISKIFPPEPTYLDMPECQVGLDSRVEHMLEMLDVGGSDVRMVGIWGIGGVGKTTIAKAVYNAIAHKFDGWCFLANVREGSVQHGGLVNLQNIILSSIVGQKESIINNVHEGISLLRKRLQHKQILLVVDNVDSLDQLEKLAGSTDWFGRGSRVIITTRDKHLLTVHGVKPTYNVHGLGHQEALELFSSNALLDIEKLDVDEKSIVTEVVNYAGGVPLALEVLGSHLCDTSVQKWRAMLDGFKKDPPKSIQDILLISYDGLQVTARNVFLEIACFFKGRNKNYVIQILEGCDHITPEHSIEVLEQKALIFVDRDGDIHMHDFLEEMGKVIVLQESTEARERSRLWYYKDVQDVLTKNRVSSSHMRRQRSRLWDYKDVLGVLTKNRGTSNIEGIMVKMPTRDEIHLSPKFDIKKMVQLNMLGSRISHLGERLERMQNLRVLDLSGNEFLAKIPDMSRIPNLEVLNLSRCTSLMEMHPSVGSLQNLKSLFLTECIFLAQIPDMSGSPKLQVLDLSGCTRLKEIHPSVGSLQNLKFLFLRDCEFLAKIPDMSGSPNLEVLDLSQCIRLKEIHPSVGYLQNLKSLLLSECIFLTQVPDMSGSPNLQFLDLRRCTSLEEIHPSVGSLQNLKSILLSGCKSLAQIPDVFGSLEVYEGPKLVTFPNKVDCEVLPTYLEVSHDNCVSLNMKKLVQPSISGSRLSRLGEELKIWRNITLQCLTSLDLSGTAIKELPTSIRYLRSLEELVLKECENLTFLPSNIYELQHLWRLDLQNCSNFVAVPEWSSLQIILNVSHNLWYLNLCGCKRLEEIPELPPTVEWINVSDCLQLKRFAKLSNILVHKKSEMIKCITMFNCKGLCDSLASEMAENKNILLNEVSLCSLFLSCKQSEFNIVFPGSEVPKWFSRRKDLMELIGKSKFSFEIPPNISLGNKGFAICAAAAAVENFNPEGKEIMQKCSFTATIDINADRIVTRAFYFEGKDIELAHVWLCYIPFVKFVSRQSPPFTCGVSLEHTSQGSMRIKSFGVHLVSPQDEDEDEDEDLDEDEDDQPEDSVGNN